MDRLVSLEEASDSLGSLVEQIEAGMNVVLTRDGTPVARLLPFSEPDAGIGRLALWQDMLARIGDGWPIQVQPFDRDSLHER